MRGVRVWGCGVIALGLLVAGAQASASHTVGSWGHGAWSWFADPRAVQVSGRTFVGWIDWHGRVTIGEYDRARRRTKFKYVVGRLKRDDHGNPSILVRPDQRLTLFWSAHGGSAIYFRTTARPAEIRSWNPVQEVPAHARGHWLGFTYPAPVWLSAERKLYLFYRGPDWGIDYSMQARGGSWVCGGRLVHNPGQRPYVKVASNHRDTIAFAFTQAHPRDRVTDIYYMVYRHGWLRRADGSPIRRLRRAPIHPHNADLVYDGRRTGASSWVWDVALGAHEEPVIVYATFPPHRHLYWYATWTGHRWRSHFLTSAGPSISPGTIEVEYVGGIAINHANPSVVYLSRKVRGWYEIERWATDDGGLHWRHTTVVRTPGMNDFRPFLTERSHGGPMSLLWLAGRYGSYKTYHTSVEYLQ